MKSMHPRLVAVTASATLLAAGACSGAGDLGEPVASSAPDAESVAEAPPDTADSLLFVVPAGSGSLSGIEDDTGGEAELVELRLEDLSSVTWFSDRPDRDAGPTGMREALETFEWRVNGDRISSDAPNATLSAVGLDSTVVLELLDATIEGEGSDAPAVSFTATVLGGSSPADLDFGAAELFIDSTVPEVTSPDAGQSPGAQADGPVEMTAPLTERVSALTTIDVSPDAQAARVSIEVDGRSVATYTLDSDSPSEVGGRRDIEGTSIAIESIRFEPATPDSEGVVELTGTVSDTSSGLVSPISGVVIAQWPLG